MGRQRVLASFNSIGKNFFRLPYTPSKHSGFGRNDFSLFSFGHHFATYPHLSRPRNSVDEQRSELVRWRWLTFQAAQMSTVARLEDHFFTRRVACPSSFVSSTSGLVRAWSYEQRCWHTSGENFDGKEKISVTFVSKDGEEEQIQVPVGMSMLEAAHENDIELEGACEGSLACSTCHVIVMDEEMYNRLPEPSDEENDMLDLAFGLTETSRLGCQVIAKPELDGLQLALPAATRNFAVDGHVPKPH